jgi:cyclohexanecarboxylate-CoA ligase
MSSFDPAAHARAMRSGGFWPDRTFDEYLTEAVRRSPGKTAIVADRADGAAGRRISFGELDDLVGRSAAAL